MWITGGSAKLGRVKGPVRSRVSYIFVGTAYFDEQCSGFGRNSTAATAGATTDYIAESDQLEGRTATLFEGVQRLEDVVTSSPRTNDVTWMR